MFPHPAVELSLSSTIEELPQVSLEVGEVKLRAFRIERDRIDAAEVRLRIWPDGEDRLLARSGFHGEKVHWLGNKG